MSEDCPADYYTDWEYYCVDDSIWRTRDFHDFYCLMARVMRT
jgi:hypothetical protein